MAEIKINGLAELESAISIEELNKDNAKVVRPARNKRNVIVDAAKRSTGAKAKAEKQNAADAAAPATDMVPIVDSKRPTRFGKYPNARVGDSTPNKLMQQIATELPIAFQTPVYYQAGESVDFNEVEGFVGTFVDFQGRRIAVDMPTPKYTLVQHQAAFAPYIEALAQHHATEHLRAAMTYNAREAFVYVSLPDALTFTPADGKPIELGFIMHNSLDRSSAVTFDGYGLRVSCMNMLGFAELLGHQSIRHTASAPEKLMDMLHGFEAATETLADQIKFARCIGVKEADAAEWFRSVYGDKLQFPLLSQFRQEEQTAWGLYQAVTNVVTHHKDFTGDKQFTALMNAEPILWTPEEEMIQIFDTSREENAEKDLKKAMVIEARTARKAARKVA